MYRLPALAQEAQNSVSPHQFYNSPTCLAQCNYGNENLTRALFEI